MSTLFQQFRKFVFEQEQDKVIQHHLGWCGCAVGEFLIWDMLTQYDPFALADALERETKVSKPVLEILNGNGRIDNIEDDDEGNDLYDLYEALKAEKFEEDKVLTYGQLQTCIKIIEDYYNEN